MKIEKGDYVLGTKWTDGMSNDPWIVGFYAHSLSEKDHIILDRDGEPFNGILGRTQYKNIRKISPVVGEYLIKNANELEEIGVCLFDVIRQLEAENMWKA